MSIISDSKYFFVLVYLWQILAMFCRTIYRFVLHRISRISRLAYQLEQLNTREEDLCRELTQLNEEYLQKSSQIQQQRTSIALERAKVLDELAQTAQPNGKVSTLTLKTVPSVKCDTISKNEIKISSNKTEKPKPVEVKKPIIKRSTSLIVPQPHENPIRWRSRSPLLASKSAIFERPRTPEVSKVIVPKITMQPETTKVEPKKKVSLESVEQTNNSFSKLIGFNLATHRVNEYIDLIVDSTINEFRSCDQESLSSNKRSQRFRATIKELYGDPEWRPFINDLKHQHKIFYYL